MRLEEVEVHLQEAAQDWLRKLAAQGTLRSNDSKGNFPITAAFLDAAGKVQVKAVRNETQRHAVVRWGVQKTNATGFVLLYEGRLSEMEPDAECLECEGKGCEECVGTGKARKGKKDDAIVTVRMRKGEKHPTVTAIRWSAAGGKVLFAKPWTMNYEGDDATFEHQYGGMWG